MEDDDSSDQQHNSLIFHLFDPFFRLTPYVCRQIFLRLMRIRN